MEDSLRSMMETVVSAKIYELLIYAVLPAFLLGFFARHKLNK